MITFLVMQGCQNYDAIGGQVMGMKSFIFRQNVPK